MEKLEDRVIRAIYQDKIGAAYEAISAVATKKAEKMLRRFSGVTGEEVLELHAKYVKLHEISILPHNFSVDELESALGTFDFDMAIKKAINPA